MKRFAMVAQTQAGMVIQSFHTTLRNATQAAKTKAKNFHVHAFAGVELTGSSNRSCEVGSVLDPEHVNWRAHRPDNHCSECCDNCIPDSLNYRCPLTRDNPLCDTVAAVRQGIAPVPPLPPPPKSALQCLKALVEAWDSIPEDVQVPEEINIMRLWDDAREAIARKTN